MKSAYNFYSAQYQQPYTDDTIIHYKLTFDNPELLGRYRFNHDYSEHFNWAEQQRLQYIVPYNKVHKSVHLAVSNIMLYTGFKETL